MFTAHFQGVQLMKTPHPKTVAEDARDITFEQMYQDPDAVRCVKHAVSVAVRSSTVSQMREDLTACAWLRIYEQWASFCVPEGKSEKHARLSWMWRVAKGRTVNTIVEHVLRDRIGGLDGMEWLTRGSDVVPDSMGELIDARRALSHLEQGLTPRSRGATLDEVLALVLKEVLEPESLTAPAQRPANFRNKWFVARRRLEDHRFMAAAVLGAEGPALRSHFSSQ